MIRGEHIMPAATATKIRTRAEPAGEPAPKSALKPAPKSRLFHARMLVTRAEEWCVEAATAKEAQVLLAAGAGHRCAPGESIQIEFEHLLDD
jgi:uncharacterized protein YbaP (TraB family)